MKGLMKINGKEAEAGAIAGAAAGGAAGAMNIPLLEGVAIACVVGVIVGTVTCLIWK